MATGGRRGEGGGELSSNVQDMWEVQERENLGSGFERCVIFIFERRAFLHLAIGDFPPALPRCILQSSSYPSSARTTTSAHVPNDVTHSPPACVRNNTLCGKHLSVSGTANGRRWSSYLNPSSVRNSLTARKKNQTDFCSQGSTRACTMLIAPGPVSLYTALSRGRTVEFQQRGPAHVWLSRETLRSKL